MLGKVVREPEGFFGMLMSGFFGLAATIGVFIGVSWLLNPSLYNISYRAVKAFFTTIWPQSSQRCFNSPTYSALPEEDEGDWSDSTDNVVNEKQVEQTKTRALRWARLKLLIATVILTVLHAVRPKAPFGHMATTLPFTIFEGLFSKRSAFCDPSPWNGPEGSPFPELTQEEFWVPPAGKEGGVGRGWKPGSPWWEVERDVPEWLPEEEVEGFGKWYRKLHHHPEHPSPPPEFAHGSFPDDRHPPPPPQERERKHKGHHGPHHPPPRPPPPGYESVLDPLKISNAGEPLLDPLRDALKQGDSQVPIKHVVMMTLESTRKDVFPLMKDGVLYEQLEESRGESLTARDEDGDWPDLSQLSPNAEFLTGENTGFERDRNKTHGGINIEGALTGSTYTLKSLLGSHCGVAPLPVDFLEELESEIYQPCLPQILNVMNKQQAIETEPDDDRPWRNATWKSVFMQGSTNKLDRQKLFMEQMGFDETVVREDLQNPEAKYPAKEPELNYFGYSEKELKPYIRDLFTSAEKNNERVFLSHLTTSTHHPWATPKEFGEQQKYWGGSRGHHSPWDRYLNSIKWADQWIGEVLSLLEELGVADETLVVVLGDHGFSFSDDSSSKTTYANSHINSFRIPMVFRHPSLPRIQLNATVTSLSILPTILDLLSSSDSLAEPQTEIARYLIPEYEGQSLIRAFIPALPSTRQTWNFGVVNPGGTHLSIISSAHPYRLVLPICEPAPYVFSDLNLDPMEKDSVRDWEGGKKLRMRVKVQYGIEAGEWVALAEKVGVWWVWESRRRWGYWEGTRRMDRGVGHLGDGFLENDHWWDT
ncbi:MAG: hypothetical protein M1835_000870 [Candelina submexicana]|nr:MAG: hypothetical protein M1835_000870 [Candelina submexicana]